MKLCLTFWWLHCFQSCGLCPPPAHFPPQFHTCHRKWEETIFKLTRTYILNIMWSYLCMEYIRNTCPHPTCLEVSAVQSVCWRRLCRWRGRWRCRWDHCLQMPSIMSQPDAPVFQHGYFGFCRSPAGSPCGQEVDDRPPPKYTHTYCYINVNWDSWTLLALSFSLDEGPNCCNSDCLICYLYNFALFTIWESMNMQSSPTAGFTHDLKC